jgi:hypothetical protein
VIQRVSFQGSVSALIPTFSRALGLVRRLGRFPINPTTTHISHHSCGTSRTWNLGVSEIWCDFFPVWTRQFHKENGDTLELGYSIFRQVHVRTCWDVILGLYIYRHPMLTWILTELAKCSQLRPSNYGRWQPTFRRPPADPMRRRSQLPVHCDCVSLCFGTSQLTGSTGSTVAN